MDANQTPNHLWFDDTLEGIGLGWSESILRLKQIWGIAVS